MQRIALSILFLLALAAPIAATRAGMIPTGDYSVSSSSFGSVSATVNNQPDHVIDMHSTITNIGAIRGSIPIDLEFPKVMGTPQPIEYFVSVSVTNNAVGMFGGTAPMGGYVFQLGTGTGSRFRPFKPPIEGVPVTIAKR